MKAEAQLAVWVYYSKCRMGRFWFEGRITLELYNANSLPIRLDAGRRVCQLVFCKMDQQAETPYKGKYQGQLISVGSRIYKDHN